MSLFLPTDSSDQLGEGLSSMEGPEILHTYIKSEGLRPPTHSPSLLWGPPPRQGGSLPNFMYKCKIPDPSWTAGPTPPEIKRKRWCWTSTAAKKTFVFDNRLRDRLGSLEVSETNC